MGFVASWMSCRARMMRPSPIETRPSCPAFVFLRDRKKTTPKKMANGESQERFSENTCAMSEVPTSAPSMMASAGASAMRFCETKELAMSAVALEDCTRLVTPRPGHEGRAPVGHALRQHAPQVRAVDAQDARAHDVRAPHEEGHAGE